MLEQNHTIMTCLLSKIAGGQDVDGIFVKFIIYPLTMITELNDDELDKFYSIYSCRVVPVELDKDIYFFGKKLVISSKLE